MAVEHLPAITNLQVYVKKSSGDRAIPASRSSSQTKASAAAAFIASFSIGNLQREPCPGEVYHPRRRPRTTPYNNNNNNSSTRQQPRPLGLIPNRGDNRLQPRLFHSRYSSAPGTSTNHLYRDPHRHRPDRQGPDGSSGPSATHGPYRQAVALPDVDTDLEEENGLSPSSGPRRDDRYRYEPAGREVVGGRDSQPLLDAVYSENALQFPYRASLEAYAFSDDDDECRRPRNWKQPRARNGPLGAAVAVSGDEGRVIAALANQIRDLQTLKRAKASQQQQQNYSPVVGPEQRGQGAAGTRNPSRKLGLQKLSESTLQEMERTAKHATSEYVSFIGQAQLCQRVLHEDKRDASEWEPCERCRLRGGRCSRCIAIRTGGGYIILDAGGDLDGLGRGRDGKDHDGFDASRSAFDTSGDHSRDGQWKRSSGGGAGGGRGHSTSPWTDGGGGGGRDSTLPWEKGDGRGGRGMGGEGRGGDRDGWKGDGGQGGGGGGRGRESELGDTDDGFGQTGLHSGQREGGESGLRTSASGGGEGGNEEGREDASGGGRGSRGGFQQTGSRAGSRLGSGRPPSSTRRLQRNPSRQRRGTNFDRNSGGRSRGDGEESDSGGEGDGEQRTRSRRGRRRGQGDEGDGGDGKGGRRYVDVKGRFEREGTDDEEERRTYGGDLYKFKSKQSDIKALQCTLKELQSIDPLDYLAKYCIIDKDKLPHYQRAFDNVDRDEDNEIDIRELDFALKAVNYQLISDQEMKYVHSVLELASRYKLNFRLFSLIAALSEKVVALEDMVKRLINDMDFKALEVKMKKCKELFYLLANSTNANSGRDEEGVVTTESLAVELQAGGLTAEHVDYVTQHLNYEGKGIVEFLDYLTYVPLFVEIHDSIYGNPLDFSRTK